MTSAPDSPAQHVAAIPGVTSAVVTDGRMLVGVEPGLDATTVALRSAIVLNALGAGLTVEVIGGRRTPSPAPLPVRWAGLSMTNMARVACAAVLAGSAGLAAVSNVSGSVSAPRFQASPALRHHRGAVPPVVLGGSIESDALGTGPQRRTEIDLSDRTIGAAPGADHLKTR